MGRPALKPLQIWQRRDGKMARVLDRVQTPFGPVRVQVDLLDSLTLNSVERYIVDEEGVQVPGYENAGDLVDLLQ